MDQQYIERISNLKRAVLEYLGTNGRHYGDLSRMEQSVEDLAQALNTRLDQLSMALECTGAVPAAESPRDKLAHRLMETAAKLTRTGIVDNDMADQFDAALDAFDIAADLKRQSDTMRDRGETAAIRHKRRRS